MKKILVGDIVISVQGRDMGTYYMVINALSDNYFSLVNGDNKTFDCPKRKAKKHIEYAGKTVEHIKEKLEHNQKVFDSEIYSAIKKFKEEKLQDNPERKQ